MDKVSLLHKAISAGDLDDVREYVESGADVNIVYGMQGTALCNALYSRHDDIIEYLIKAGSDVNIPDYGGEPPVLLALRKGLLEAANLLIDTPGCNINTRDPATKTTPLCFASENGMINIVKHLISKPTCKTDSVDGNGNSALHLAVLKKHNSIIETLSRIHGLKCVCNEAGLMPVHMVSKSGDVDVLKIMYDDNLKCGVSFAGRVSKDLNSGTSYTNDTPLMLAAESRHTEMLTYLIEQGVNVNATNYRGNTALFIASSNNDLITASILLNVGADPNISGTLRIAGYVIGIRIDSEYRITPLEVAAMFDLVELAEALVMSGARIQTALFKALQNNSTYVAWFLLNQAMEQNLDLTDFNSAAQSLLHVVVMCTEQAYDLTKFLIQHGCSITNRDRLSNLPIQMAIAHENADVVKAILEEGGDAQVVDDRGFSLLHMSASVGNIKIAKLLLSHGADIDGCSEDGTVLYTALDAYMVDFAKFLVDAGCSLHNEWYLFEGQCEEHDLEFPEVLEEFDEFFTLLKEKAINAPTLQSLCIKNIRSIFYEKHRLLSDIVYLPLPSKIIDVLCYRKMEI